MLSTYIIYSFTAFLSITFAFFAGRYNKLWFKRKYKYKDIWFTFLSLVVIVLVAGIRADNVGTDAKYYKSFYLQFKSMNYNIFSMFNILDMNEPGYLFVNYILAKIGGHHIVFFILMSLLTWFFFFKAFSEEKQILYLVIFFMFCTGFFSFTLNGMRQAISATIFLYSLKFITNRNLLKFLFFISLAACFHFSALLLFPLYFILPYISGKPIVWLSLTIISFFIIIVDLSFLDYIISNIPGGYAAFLQYSELFPQHFKTTYSVGNIFELIIGLFTIYFYTKQKYLHPKYKYIFIFSFIYTILLNIFWSIPILLRFAAYFHLFQIYVLAIITKNYIVKNNYLATYIIFMVFTALFFYKIYVNDSGMYPYLFWFQT